MRGIDSEPKGSESRATQKSNFLSIRIEEALGNAKAGAFAVLRNDNRGQQHERGNVVMAEGKAHEPAVGKGEAPRNYRREIWSVLAIGALLQISLVIVGGYAWKLDYREARRLEAQGIHRCFLCGKIATESITYTGARKVREAWVCSEDREKAYSKIYVKQSEPAFGTIEHGYCYGHATFVIWAGIVLLLGLCLISVLVMRGAIRGDDESDVAFPALSLVMAIVQIPLLIIVFCEVGFLRSLGR
jgi:hypothetical protein